jgi:hypothetical protein
MRIDSPISSNAQITGSFTGSFFGDGSGLTGVTAEWDGSHNGDATITGNLTVNSNIIVDGTVDGVDVAALKTSVDAILASSEADKDSFAEIVTLINSVDTTNDTAFAGFVTSSNARATDIENSVTSLSGSAHSQRTALHNLAIGGTSALSSSAHAQRVALNSAQSTALSNVSGAFAVSQAAQDVRLGDLEAFSSSLDATFATEAEVTSAVSTLSGSAHTQRIAIKNDLDSNISALSSSAHSQRVAIESGLDSDINSLSGSAHIHRKALIGALSASVDAHLDANISALSASTDAHLDAKVSTLNSSISSLSGSAHSQRTALYNLAIGGDSALSSSAHTQRVALNSAQSTALTSVSGAFASTVSNLSNADSLLAGRVTTLEGKDISITLTGDVSGTGTITNLGNVSFSTTVADDSHNHIISNVDGLQAALDLKAPLASPALTGNPTAPTQTGTDDSTKIATTAFVQGRIDAIIGTAGATLDTLGELSASLAADQSGLAALTTTVGGKLQKDQNLSDLTNAATARTNLGVDAAGTINYVHPTHPGDDFSVDTGALTGASVVSRVDINVTTDTSGHVTDANGSVTTRTLTLADLGYSGATNADNYSSWTIRDGDTTTYTITSGDTLQIASGTGITSNFTADDVLTITNTAPDQTVTLTGAGATSVSGTYPNFTITSTDTNTVYTHPTYAGDDINVDTGALTGATVISDLDFNITTDTSGHVTDANAAIATRTLTLADLGYTGATNANYITNNNQLTNGAGYTTYSANQSLNNSDNVHFEGLMVGQTSGATANTIRCVGDVVAYYSSDAQFKDNVETLEGALDKVKAIRGVRFDWNDKQDVFEGHDIGVIAQEVEAVLPELVHYRAHNDSKAVDYVKLTAVLIEAVKELAAKVEELSK